MGKPILKNQWWEAVEIEVYFISQLNTIMRARRIDGLALFSSKKWGELPGFSKYFFCFFIVLHKYHLLKCPHMHIRCGHFSNRILVFYFRVNGKTRKYSQYCYK